MSKQQSTAEAAEKHDQRQEQHARKEPGHVCREQNATESQENVHLTVPTFSISCRAPIPSPKGELYVQ